jgi:putative ABC transport system permease protein
MKTALRLCRHSPGFTAAAVLSIALAVGANTAVFSIVNAVWLRPLPVEDPERLVVPYLPVEARSDGSVLDVQSGRLRPALAALDGFSAVTFELAGRGLFTDWAPVVRLQDGGTPLAANAVAANYFETLGVKVRGRTFLTEEEEPGSEVVGIISDAFWRHHFGADPDVIGTRLQTTGGPIVIVGIVDGRFRAARFGEARDLWIPFGAIGPFSDVGAGVPNHLMPLTAFARLRPGVTLDAAQAQVRGVLGRKAMLRSLRSVAFPLRSEHDVLRQTTVLRMLWLAPLIVLTLGCANLAALLLARWEGRRHELAVRTCIGAAPTALTRLVMTEAALLCLAGLATGLVFAHWLIAGVASFEISRDITVDEIEATLDWRVFGFGVIVAAAATLIAAVGTLRRAARTDLAVLISSAATTGTPRTLRARQWLLAAHVTLSVSLLGGAAALAWNVQLALGMNLGFARDEVLFVQMRPRLSDEPGDRSGLARHWNEYRLLLDRLSALEGVRAAAYGAAIIAPQLTPTPATLTTSVGRVEVPLTALRVGPNYLSAAGARFRGGRDLVLADEYRAIDPVDFMKARVDAIRTGKPYRPPARVPAVVVDASFAEALWPGTPAVGQTFIWSKTGATYEVVGVVEPIRHGSKGPEAATIFELQSRGDDEGVSGLTGAEFMIRTYGSAVAQQPAVLATIKQVFPDPARLSVRTADALVAEERATEKIGARVFWWFGLTSAILGLAGIYGLVAYLVLRQRRELGIRAALGATSEGLRRMMMLRVMKPVGLGAFAGVALSMALMKVLSAVFPGFDSVNPSAHALAALMFACVAWFASFTGAAGTRTANAADLLRSS